MADTLYAIMRQKRNTYAWFQTNNPVLEDGQIGVIISGQHRNCFKIGNGVTPWNSLPWVTDYEILFNKPSINGVTLTGNRTLADFGAATAGDVSGVQAAISAEITARQNADALLQTNLDAEAAARQSADGNLQNQITDIEQTLDEIPDIYAPIDSPTLTGIPLTPRPDGTIPEQIEQVGRVNDLFEEIQEILPDFIVTLTGEYVASLNGVYFGIIEN